MLKNDWPYTSYVIVVRPVQCQVGRKRSSIFGRDRIHLSANFFFFRSRFNKFEEFIHFKFIIGKKIYYSFMLIAFLEI